MKEAKQGKRLRIPHYRGINLLVALDLYHAVLNTFCLDYSFLSLKEKQRLDYMNIV